MSPLPESFYVCSSTEVPLEASIHISGAFVYMSGDRKARLYQFTSRVAFPAQASSILPQMDTVKKCQGGGWPREEREYPNPPKCEF